MIVQCASCRTRFRVDESRIPGRGARMRCRRCGEAIIVMKKEEERRPAAPAPRQNLFDLRSVLRRSDGPTPGIPADPAPSEEGARSEQPGRPSGDDLRATESGPAELRADAGADLPAAEEGAPPVSAAPAEVGEPYLRLPQSASGEPSVAPDEAESLPRREKPEVAGEEPAASSPTFSLGLEPPAEKERPFELILEDAELLDFLKQGDRPGEFDISRNLRPHPAPEEEPAHPPPAVEETPAAAPMSERLEAIQRELEEIGGGAPAEEDTPPAPPREPAAARPAPVKPYPPVAPPRPVRAVRSAVVTLLVLFLLLAGGGAYLGFTRSGQEILRSLIPRMEALWLGGENAGSRYAVGDLIGYYEANAKAGRIFVIRGLVTNQGRIKRSGVLVHADVLGKDGRTVAEKAAYAGNILSGEALRTSSRQAIEEGMSNRWGDALMNLDIPPGKSVPFMVVFFDAPEGIEAYRLDARDVE